MSLPLVTTALPDGTVLPDCRPDLLSIGDFLARNWSVIPLHPRSKFPAVKWEPYQRRHANADELERWFSRPGFNVGIVTGAISGIFVVDADSPEAWAWAAANLPPSELRVRTATGVHLYFPYVGARSMKNKVRINVDGRALEIDIRAEGGYVVAPGSIHPSGAIYTREGRGWC